MMTRNVATEIAELPRLNVRDSRSRYAEVFGEPTNTSNKQWLAKRIAWRLQSLAEGGLSERARKCAAELDRDADLRTTIPRVPVAPERSVALSPKRFRLTAIIACPHLKVMIHSWSSEKALGEIHRMFIEVFVNHYFVDRREHWLFMGFP